MKYNRCIKCEINYVLEYGEMCALCKSIGEEVGSCIYCGGVTSGGKDICEVCEESLSVSEREKIFIDD